MFTWKRGGFEKGPSPENDLDGLVEFRVLEFLEEVPHDREVRVVVLDLPASRPSGSLRRRGDVICQIE